MKYFQKKEASSRPFSYIDVFFLLLAVLTLSFGIYGLAERRDQRGGALFQAELSASISKDLKLSIPEAGDALLEGDTVIGEVLSVEIRETSEIFLVKVFCEKKGKVPKTGEKIKLETTGSVCEMQVVSVKEKESGKGRWMH